MDDSADVVVIESDTPDDDVAEVKPDAEVVKVTDTSVAESKPEPDAEPEVEEVNDEPMETAEIEETTECAETTESAAIVNNVETANGVKHDNDEPDNDMEPANDLEAVSDKESVNDVEPADDVEPTNDVELVNNVETIKSVETTETTETVGDSTAEVVGNGPAKAVEDGDSKPVNGTEEIDDSKDSPSRSKESPIRSPPEIENMTVVDEDIEILSDDEEEKEKEDEKEKVKEKEVKEKEIKEVKETKSKEKEPERSTRRSSKRKNTDHESSSSKKRSPHDSSKSDHREPDAKKSLPLLGKYWKAVKEDPTDFTGWTYLLQYVDQANDVAAASEVYNDFLSRYPYCYGYWRKYADYLKKNGQKSRCEEIFEKGVSAIPLSVDLWIHYLNYMKDVHASNEELLRTLFERSLKSCGLEFRSDRLWDAYTKWEIEGGRLQNATAIFDRWLAVPTQGYVTVMEKFKDHIKKNSPTKVLDPEEFFALRNDVVSETKATNAELESKLSDDAPPGEETPDRLDKLNEEETKALKEKIISIRKERQKVTQKDALARWSYEENIKRPYFHVKPLEQCQLNNWKEYLDFEIKEGNQDRIILLFERCLIACALYEEFWVKFIEYLLAQPEVPVEKVRDVFRRACTIHHTKKINIHLKWSAFEETFGNSLQAAQILEDLEKTCPGILMVMSRRINIIRRRGEYEKVCSYYEKYMEANAEKKAISSSLAIKYARFYCKVMNEPDKGIEVLKKAIEKDPENSRLKLQLIDIHMGKVPIELDEVVNIMDAVINTEQDNEKKLLFAQRKLEFLEEFAEECVAVQKAHEAYDTLVAVVAEKKKELEEKKNETAKKNGSGEQVAQPPTTAAYTATTAQPYYPTAATPQAYQAYPQTYVTTTYPQQNIYQPADPNYGYQNWQSYGAYNQQWPSGTAPQAGAAGGYYNMY